MKCTGLLYRHRVNCGQKGKDRRRLCIECIASIPAKKKLATDADGGREAAGPPTPRPQHHHGYHYAEGARSSLQTANPRLGSRHRQLPAKDTLGVPLLDAGRMEQIWCEQKRHRLHPRPSTLRPVHQNRQCQERWCGAHYLQMCQGIDFLGVIPFASQQIHSW